MVKSEKLELKSYNMGNQNIIVTGGSGFIGSNFIRYILAEENVKIINIDNLSYAGNLITTKDFKSHSNYKFIKGSINDRKLIEEIFKNFQPNVLINFAAESHVDRSIDDSSNFINTNILGTFNLLEISRRYFFSLKDSNFKFIHISTDEVFGSVENNLKFNEYTAYNPSSPYSASKASSDHLVRAWYKTYKLPTIITNCSNNYGPFQYPEKLIPLSIINALSGNDIRIYGDGKQVRDWLHVNDHVSALKEIINRGQIGSTYNIGGENLITNIDLIHKICNLLNAIKPKNNKYSYKELIKFVSDRPGHDQMYAVDTTKIKRELNWKPQISIEQGLRDTIDWYLTNQEWCKSVTENIYDYDRLGAKDQ